jgi:hypothetical protein
MADFAAARRTHAARLADRVGREVVVQQEGFLVGAGQRVDVLLVLAGAERGDHDRLRLAAGEQRRTVGARQDADFRFDRRTVFRSRPSMREPVSRMFQRTILACRSLNTVATCSLV